MSIIRKHKIVSIDPQHLAAEISLGAMGLLVHLLAAPDERLDLDRLTSRFPDDDLLVLAEELIAAGIVSFGSLSEQSKAPGLVYVAVGGPYCKIGVTQNIPKRVKALQTGNPHKVTVVYRRWFEDCIAIERAVHAELANIRRYGEWFACLPRVAVAALEKVIAAQK